MTDLLRRVAEHLVDRTDRHELLGRSSLWRPGHLDDYFIDMRSKLALLPADPHSQVAILKAGTPVELCQWAIAFYQRWRRERRDQDLAGFMTCADILVETQHRDGPYRGGWPHDLPSPYKSKRPWLSAMAQGEALSVLVRASNAAPARARYERAARLAVQPFLKDLEQGGVTCRDDAGCVYLEEYPSDPPSHVLNGWIFAWVGVREFADTFSDKAADGLAAKSLAEGDDELLVRVRYYLGIVYEEQGRGVLALSMWEANLAAVPEHADSNNAVAYHYAEAGEKLTEALEFIQKALSKDPENAAYLDTLGWVYYKMQRYKRAAEVLAKAAEKMSDAIILDHLGDALLRTGDIDGALEAWKKSLENKPKESDRDATEEKIRSNTAPAEGEVQEKPGGEGDGGS